MYMQDYVELNDNEGIVLPAVLGIRTSTGTEHDKCPISVHVFTHEQGKESYCF